MEGLAPAIETQDASQGEHYEAENTAETTDVAPQQVPANTKPSGYDPVDLSGLPEELAKPISDRLDYLYRQVKDGQREKKSVSREINELRGIAQQQYEIINELQNGVGAVVSHWTQTAFANTEAQLQQKMQQALEAGDTAGFFDAQNKLLDIKVQQKLQPQAQQQKQPQAQPQMAVPYNSGRAVADDALADGELTQEDYTAVNAWINERDQSGTAVRPWAVSRTPDNPTNDPVYRRALIEMAAVFDEASPYANLSMEQKLSELDKRMGVQRSQPEQAVLGGNLTTHKKSATLRLTPKQQEIAIRTKFAGPGKSEADHIAAYRKQIEQTKRGGR